MEFRKAKLTDNIEEIAELIYQTDKFIYPYWFADYSNYKKILMDLIMSPNSLFSYQNIFVAVENNRVYGIIISITQNSNLNYDYNNLKSINKNFEYTINNYILPITTHINDNTVYISNVCVDKENRRHKIATLLFEAFKIMYPKQTYELDVLANNIPAINFYKKQGFEIIETKIGFNAPRKRKPQVFGMIRKQK